MIKPHQTFEYIRADEIAECWDGITESLYLKLWNDIVPLQRAIPNLEDTGPADHVGHENLASHWHLLTEVEQLRLNQLAEAQDAEYRAAYPDEAPARDPRLAWFDDTDSCSPDAGNAFLADLGDDIESDLDAPAAPAAGHDMRGQLATADDARAFMLAGKATVTLVSLKTGNRFTYRISAAPDGLAFFVGLLTGPDNSADYKYLGRIAVRPAGAIFYAGRKSPKPGDIGPDAPSARAFDYAWRAIAQGTLPAQLQIWHEGRCGRCARKLTVPSSVAQGFGPECIGKL
jgi:hypothetical protein